MDTLTFRRGDSAVWTFAPEDGTGQPVDLTGAAARVEVHTGPPCVTLALIRTADGFEWRMNDATMPDLPARPYRATLWIDWPDGTRDRDDFTLLIEAGCP